MWVGEIIVSGTRLNPNMYVAGERALGNYCRGTEVGRGVCTFTAHNANLTGTLVKVFAVQWGVLRVCFFPVRFLRLREKIFRRSRHLTDSIWRSHLPMGEERGDRRPTLRICNKTKYWFLAGWIKSTQVTYLTYLIELTELAPKWSRSQEGDTRDNGLYIRCTQATQENWRLAVWLSTKTVSIRRDAT